MFSVVLVSRTLAAVRPAILQWTRASTRGLASAIAAPPMQTLRVLAKRFEDADFFEVEIDTGMSVSFHFARSRALEGVRQVRRRPAPLLPGFLAARN